MILNFLFILNGIFVFRRVLYNINDNAKRMYCDFWGNENLIVMHLVLYILKYHETSTDSFVEAKYYTKLLNKSMNKLIYATLIFCFLKHILLLYYCHFGEWFRFTKETVCFL